MCSSDLTHTHTHTDTQVIPVSESNLHHSLAAPPTDTPRGCLQPITTPLPGSGGRAPDGNGWKHRGGEGGDFVNDHRSASTHSVIIPDFSRIKRCGHYHTHTIICTHTHTLSLTHTHIYPRHGHTNTLTQHLSLCGGGLFKVIAESVDPCH